DLPELLSAAVLAQSGLAFPVMDFSALTGAGLDDLRERLAALVESLAAATGATDGVAISRERHRDALARARTSLVAARDSATAAMPPEIIAVDVALAAEALGSITGEVSTEDVLDAVFREFCIGK